MPSELERETLCRLAELQARHAHRPLAQRTTSCSPAWDIARESQFSQSNQFFISVPVTVLGHCDEPTPALIAEICDRITDGEAIRQIAGAGGLDDPISSRGHLFRMEDGLLEIADDVADGWMEQGLGQHA